jgi:hypothetical protein
MVLSLVGQCEQTLSVNANGESLACFRTYLDEAAYRWGAGDQVIDLGREIAADVRDGPKGVDDQQVKVWTVLAGSFPVRDAQVDLDEDPVGGENPPGRYGVVADALPSVVDL